MSPQGKFGGDGGCVSGFVQWTFSPEADPKGLDVQFLCGPLGGKASMSKVKLVNGHG